MPFKLLLLSVLVFVGIHQPGSVFAKTIWGTLAVSPGSSGWTTFTPTTVDASVYPASDMSQPGSRLIYISSSSGSDNTGQLYFWNGSQIVDASGSPAGKDGKLYGNDPMNPTGPIKPFKRWSYVAPRRYGEDIGYPWDGTSYLAPGDSRASTRYGYPDWWLFKRGDTFNLADDFLSFARETTPTLTEVNGGGLVVGGGNSTTAMQIVGAYGSTYFERPRLVNPPTGTFISRGNMPVPKHIAYLSLRFDGRTDNRGSGFSFLSQTEECKNILFEDCWFDGMDGTSAIQNTSGEFVFRRCTISDTWKASHTAHTQGIYFSGNRDCIMRFEECTFMRNGFSHGDPAADWPPSGEQIYDIFNRNMYISGECDNIASGLFDSISMVGASGDQFRCGMQLERNFFYQGYVSLGGHGGYADSDGATGSMRDNVLLRYDGKNTEDNRGHPGWPFILTSGSYQVDVTRNIVANTQFNVAYPAFQIECLGWYCYSHVFHYATRNNTIHDNIFDSGNASAALRVVDGISNDSVDCAGWTYPGVINNLFENNVLINERNTEYEYRPDESATGTANDTAYNANRLYTSRASAASAEGWPDPNRNLKTYMQSLGYAVASEDGFTEFFREATKQRKGYWRQAFTSRALINYFREGYGMTTLSYSSPADINPGPDYSGKAVLAYPVPATDQVNFILDTDAAAAIVIHVYNAKAEKVAQITKDVDGGPGRVIIWRCTGYSAGLYFARVMKDGELIQTLKLALIK